MGSEMCIRDSSVYSRFSLDLCLHSALIVVTVMARVNSNLRAIYVGLFEVCFVHKAWCYCRLASKQKSRGDGLSDPVLFDNLDYSRLSDATDATAVNTFTLFLSFQPRRCRLLVGFLH